MTRDEEGQRLAGASASGDDVALQLLGLGDGLHLVLVEMQVCGLALNLSGLEKICACRVQAAVP
jgi:hypothetical protein